MVSTILSSVALLLLVVVLVMFAIFMLNVIRSVGTIDFSNLLPRHVRRGPNISVISLNREYESMTEQVQSLLDIEESGAVPDSISKKNEDIPSASTVARDVTDEEGDDEDCPRMFALDYKGDIMGTSNDDLIAMVTTILGVARPGDEVAISIESGGGTVPAYGQAASQIQRLKDAGVKVTACIDKIAASGGYMMACVADKIVCAPFGIVGSIGVVSAFPNYNNLLGKFGIQYKEYTAGEFKRTVSPMAPITEEKEAKFIEQLEDTHRLFKEHVLEHRPNLDIDTVATGEHWYGKQALEKGLVDELATSDDWLLKKIKDYEVYMVRFTRPLTLRERFSESIADAGVKIVNRLLTASNNASIQ